jgi:hypothetical protein
VRLTDLMVRHNPAAIIDQTLGQGNRIPVFTLAGNHDYYSLGYAFYNTFTAMNTEITGATQEASYFCLRTADGGWQFLAMDTGWGDANPLDQVNPNYAGPQQHATEVAWLQNKLNTFTGATILLSHHRASGPRRSARSAARRPPRHCYGRLRAAARRHVRAGAARGRGASRGDRQLERIAVSGVVELGRRPELDGEELVQRVDDVLARFLPGCALADRAADLRDTRQHPAIAGILVDDRQPQRIAHLHQVCSPG